MAHVDDRRGQIMVVMSLVLAVMLVAMALYLNTAIFTENLATRKGDIAGAGAAGSYKVAVVEGASGAMAYANTHNNSSYADLDDRFERDLGNWSNATEQLEAARTRSANVSLVDTTEGTLILQDDRQLFTNESGAEDWHVANDTNGVRAYRMNVTRSDLGDSWPGNAPHQDDLFTATFDGATARSVQVYANKSEDDIHVTVLDETDSEIGSCTAENEAEATIDVSGATLDGEPCEPLRFFDVLGSNYDVVYNNSHNAGGTYRMVVGKSTGTFAAEVGNNYNNPTLDSPYYTVALYEAEIEVAYETARIDYVTVVRVGPGESE